MILRWLLAAFHLLALGFGLGAIVTRAFALRSPFSESRLPSVLLADTVWGVAAVLWFGTGLWRAFGGLEKGTAYYLASNAFWTKMALLAVVLLLEVWPMITLIRWRVARSRGHSLGLGAAPALARISAIQAALVVAMVFAATAMARGLGF
jgi:putative membrane protein